MPGIKNLVDQQLYKLHRDRHYGTLDELFHGTVDWDLINEQWDQMVRVAAALKNRNTPPEVVVQRLARAGSADRLAKALTAFGRIIKTIYILRYIQEEDLRRGVQLQLNRGEHRHILAKWFFFANRGEFRDGDIRACSHYWGGWCCERKSGQTPGPHGQVFVRGVEMKPSPKAVAGPPSRARMKYGPIFAATLRAGASFPDFCVDRR